MTTIISEELIKKIQSELIEKNYYDDVKYNLDGKSRWKSIGDKLEALAHIIMGLTSILAFATAYFDDVVFSFVAGCTGILALVMLRLSSYAMRESRERTEQVNRILENLGLRKIPDITIDSAGYGTSVEV